MLLTFSIILKTIKIVDKYFLIKPINSFVSVRETQEQFYISIFINTSTL